MAVTVFLTGMVVQHRAAGRSGGDAGCGAGAPDWAQQSAEACAAFEAQYASDDQGGDTSGYDQQQANLDRLREFQQQSRSSDSSRPTTTTARSARCSARASQAPSTPGPVEEVGTGGALGSLREGDLEGATNAGYRAPARQPRRIRSDPPSGRRGVATPRPATRRPWTGRGAARSRR
jgi:hypothetical protein